MSNSILPLPLNLPLIESSPPAYTSLTIQLPPIYIANKVSTTVTATLSEEENESIIELKEQNSQSFTILLTTTILSTLLSSLYLLSFFLPSLLPSNISSSNFISTEIILILISLGALLNWIGFISGLRFLFGNQLIFNLIGSSDTSDGEVEMKENVLKGRIGVIGSILSMWIILLLSFNNTSSTELKVLEGNQWTQINLILVLLSAQFIMFDYLKKEFQITGLEIRLKSSEKRRSRVMY